MKKIPYLSIIVPTYNDEKTIKSCLNSVLNQTFKDYEILIIDCVSVDNTLTIIKSFNDKRIRILSQQDKGVYDAMNKGIKKANGKWLYFLGSDDTLFENKTLEKINHLKLPNMNVVYGNVKIKGDSGWAKNNDIYDGKFTTEKIINKNISHQAIFYKTKFVKEKIGYFNLNYSVCSDWDFNLRCWSLTEFYYIDIIVANFASGGISTNGSDDLFSEDFLNNILKYFKINIFHKLINSPNFKRYPEVIKLQKKTNLYRFKFENLIKVLLKKISKK